jgi:alanyl aminopeptidase
VRKLSLPAAFLLAPLLAAGSAMAQAPAGSGDFPAGRLTAAVQPTAYRLDLRLLPEESGFSGVTEIDVTVPEPLTVMHLHGNGLAVESAVWTSARGKELAARYEQLDPSGVVRLTFPAPVPAGKGTLRLRYTATYGRAGEGLYKSVVGDDAYLFTQFQPTDARRMFPGFDEPGFKTPFEIAVTTRDSNVVIGNTPVRRTQPAGDGLQRVEFEPTLPLPTYLLALAVGPLDVVEAPPLPPNAVRERPLPLRGVATRGKGPRLAYALANTAAMVDYLEGYFAVPFPYPKLDLIASPDFGGGMENAGAIIYGDPNILLADNASFEQKRGFGGIHAHELAHQWFGDLVTPRWWDDIWLNEAFATWMGNKAGHAWEPALRLDLVPALQTPPAMDQDSRISARRIRNPVARNDDIGGAFDGITYLKGGAVLGMFESWLGEENFRAGIRTHMQRFPHAVADVNDFMASLADGSRRPDVVPAFRSFIDQPGVPLATMRLACTDGGASLLVEQSRYLPVGSRGETRQSWQLPLCVRFADGNGTQKQCALVKEPQATIRLETTGCPSFVMPNANGAGYYRFALDPAGWQALMANFSQLNEVEAMAVADSLWAAWQADRLATADYLAAVAVIAAAPSPTVAVVPAASLVRLRDDLGSAESRPAVLALMRTLYQPRLAALGPAPAGPGSGLQDPAAVEQALFRTRLTRLLALEAGDEALANRLAADASRFLRQGEAGGGLDPAALSPALTDIALAAGVRQKGLPFVETLVERMLASNDVRFRTQAASALGTTDDPVVGDRVRALLLDERLRGREPTLIGFALAARPSQRRATFDWFKANHEAFIARTSASFGQRWLPRFGAGFCSLPERNEVEAFFAPLVPKLPGADRTLAESLEGIELCAALAKARRDEVVRYFAGDAGTPGR